MIVASPADYVDVASRIGRRLAKDALWEGERCTWEVIRPARGPGMGRNPMREVAGGCLYQGTAGIALFLAILFEHTRDSMVERAAVGGIRHSIATPDRGSDFGFYSGRLGIAYAAAEIGRRVHAPDLVETARHIVAQVAGSEATDNVLDVIGGAAGAVPALLYLGNVLGDDVAVEMAERLGDRMIATARREPGGWSWDSRTRANVRNLTGLAHGASGFGWGFLELHRATGNEKYRYAAEQAFAYEDQFFDPVSENWPDFRDHTLMDYTLYHRLSELRARLEQGDLLPPAAPRYGSAWCHGAPGIGLARWRAFELIGRSSDLFYANAATRRTCDGLDAERAGFSLCHGLAGNCETLLLGSRILGDSDLRLRVEQVMMEGAERFEFRNTRWPCGTLQSIPDPSLMVGEAGIGYFFLRLHSASVPPILLLAREGSGNLGGGEKSASHELRSRDANTYFSRTLAVRRRLGQPSILNEVSEEKCGCLSEVTKVYMALEGELADDQDGTLKTWLADAFRVEQLRYSMATEILDFTEEVVRELNEPIDIATLSDAAVLRLGCGARLISTEYDWDAWLKGEGGANEQREPPRGPVTYVLFRQGNCVCVHRLGALGAGVFGSVGLETTLRALEDDLVTAFRSDAHDLAEVSALRGMIRKQVERALEAGLLEASEPGAIPRVRQLRFRA